METSEVSKMVPEGNPFRVLSRTIPQLFCLLQLHRDNWQYFSHRLHSISHLRFSYFLVPDLLFPVQRLLCWKRNLECGPNAALVVTSFGEEGKIIGEVKLSQFYICPNEVTSEAAFIGQN